MRSFPGIEDRKELNYRPTAFVARQADIESPDRVGCPELGESFSPTMSGGHGFVAFGPPRLPHGKVAQLFWHNDMSRLLLEIKEELAAGADEKARGVSIRRLQHALKADNG